MSAPATVGAQDSPPDASEAPGPIHGAVRSWSIGDRVRVQRQKKSSGTWPRYVGRVGTVQCFDNAAYGEIGYHAGKVYEVGVLLDGGQSNRCVWFTADELVAEHQKPGAMNNENNEEPTHQSGETTAERKGPA